MPEFRYKGFCLQQNEKENHHYMILEEKGEDDPEFRGYCSYTNGLLTQDEAERIIDNFIAYSNKDGLI